MKSLDLSRLEQRLRQTPAIACLDRFLTAIERSPGPYDWQVIAEADWKDFVIPSAVADRLHSTTISRLEGPVTAYAHRDAKDLFRRVKRREPDLFDVLRTLRRGVTPYRDGLRTRMITAPAGYTRQVAIFPPPERIKAALGSAAGFREAQLLHHPVWNALLLYLLLLRIHPFGDGNGRTLRALVNYEIWRAGLIAPALIPSKRVLDANRANEISTRTAVSNAADPDSLADAVRDALCFDLTILAMTVERCAVARAPRSVAPLQVRG